MKPAILIPAILAAALLSGCSALRDFHAANPDFGSSQSPYEKIQFAAQVATPDERARCEAAGGTVERAGRAGWERCVQSYPDAGKACSDSTECLGECRVPDDKREIKAGTPVEGVCQAKDVPFGCHAKVEKGVAGPFICVD